MMGEGALAVSLWTGTKKAPTPAASPVREEQWARNAIRWGMSVIERAQHYVGIGRARGHDWLGQRLASSRGR